MIPAFSAARQYGAVWILSFLLAMLAGCAQPTLQNDAVAGTAAAWSGRMALAVDGNAQQSFSAVFALEGTSERGQLKLSTPLGSILADLIWTPSGAELTSPQGKRTAPSLGVLVSDVLGSPVPVEALFAWLKGDAVVAAGWHADLGRLPHGRLSAVRDQPAPRTTLKLVLDGH